MPSCLVPLQRPQWHADTDVSDGQTKYVFIEMMIRMVKRFERSAISYFKKIKLKPRYVIQAVQWKTSSSTASFCPVEGADYYDQPNHKTIKVNTFNRFKRVGHLLIY